jgi:hypothetical protein
MVVGDREKRTIGFMITLASKDGENNNEFVIITIFMR